MEKGDIFPLSITIQHICVANVTKSIDVVNKNMIINNRNGYYYW